MAQMSYTISDNTSYEDFNNYMQVIDNHEPPAAGDTEWVHGSINGGFMYNSCDACKKLNENHQNNLNNQIDALDGQIDALEEDVLKLRTELVDTEECYHKAALERDDLVKEKDDLERQLTQTRSALIGVLNRFNKYKEALGDINEKISESNPIDSQIKFWRQSSGIKKLVKEIEIQ